MEAHATSAAAPTVLGVERSISGKRWRARLADDRPALALAQALELPEKRIIERALAHCDGNRERTARLLAINRSTLFQKLRKYAIR